MTKKTPEEIAENVYRDWWIHCSPNSIILNQDQLFLEEIIAEAIREDRKAREWPSVIEVSRAFDEKCRPNIAHLTVWMTCSEWLKAHLTGGEK